MGIKMEPRDEYIELNGLRFHYRECGSHSNPVLLVLHGLNSHSWDWDFLSIALSDRYRVIALDQRGHGASDWAQDYSWQRFQEDLEALVQAFSLERFTLLGYSVAGGIAYVYAGMHPQEIARL